MSRFNTLKGVQDICPPDVLIWQEIERTSREVFHVYGFREIKIPIIEYTDLFVRSIGGDTDIVEKEMYTFTDRGGRSVTLRPEGTASVVRCYVENHMHNLPSPQKFYYSGPMFRYERPQKGRFRQFYQIGAEAFGSESARCDAEMLSMVNTILMRLSIGNLRMEINSIGCNVCRPRYREALVSYFSEKEENLCTDCKARLRVNPLRLLDCKIETCVPLKADAPSIPDYLCDGCRAHHERLKELLAACNVNFYENPLIVRGLDYYTRTTFEVTTEHLGAQKAVAAGGRYDYLVKEFGGPSTAAIGFAMGMERLAALMSENIQKDSASLPIYFAPLGQRAESVTLSLSEKLRAGGLGVEPGDGGTLLKSHMKKADKLNAAFVVIVGDEELDKGYGTWRRLCDGTQGEIALDTPETVDNLLRLARCQEEPVK